MVKFNAFLKLPLYAYIIGGLIILTAAGFIYFRSAGEALPELAEARRDSVVQEVSVTGKIKPAESVSLGFDKGGRIAGVFVKVGDRVFAGKTLVALYNADLTSQLAEAEADLKAERAELEELKRGPRPEDLRISEAKAADARRNLIDKISDAQTKADDAIHNKVDQIFSNPLSSSPQLNFSSPQLEEELENERVVLEKILNEWSPMLWNLNSAENLEPFVADSEDKLARVKNFLDKAALAVNNHDNSTYKTDVSAARTNINTAINNLSGAAADWRIAGSELALTLAGTASEKISAQEAQVERAEAGVSNIQAQISKTLIISPLNGIVTRQDAKTGEIVAANTALVSVISSAGFEIEANLPEADVAKVKIGDAAKLTLDAYGSDVIFEARVSEIDPAETVVEGISTYKITLSFLKADERIKSGMTANIDISTARRENVIAIPQRAVITKNGDKIVRVQNADGSISEIRVATGLLGSDGRIEVTSGLKEGDKVIISRGTD